MKQAKPNFRARFYEVECECGVSEEFSRSRTAGVAARRFAASHAAKCSAVVRLSAVRMVAWNFPTPPRGSR